MKLFSHSLSPNSRKVLVSAHLLGTQLEIEECDILGNWEADDEFLALNPNGLTPLLIDGNFSLWESNAIMQYLASQTPGQKLWPDDPRQRAEVAKWQFWQSSHWGPACGTVVYERLAKRLMADDTPTDTARLHDALDAIHRFGEVLDGQLSRRDWLVGDHLTLADVSVSVYLTYHEPARMPIDGFDHLRCWLDRITELDAWIETLPETPKLPD